MKKLEKFIFMAPPQRPAVRATDVAVEAGAIWGGETSGSDDAGGMIRPLRTLTF
jgi:hypothetical protein